MRPACRPGMRNWLLLAAAVLALSGVAAGCGSSKPAYCTAASQLSTSVHDLAHVSINISDLSSVQTAVGKVQANAKTFASEAKSAYPSQITALRTSLSGLQAAVRSALGQPSLSTVAAVVSAVGQVKTAAGNLQQAASGKCK